MTVKMATQVRHLCYFCSQHGIVLLFLCTTVVYPIYGEQVHLMSMTPTPYGAPTLNTPSPLVPSFVCLLSPPDTALVNDIETGRHVLRGRNDPFNTLMLPSGSITSILQTNVGNIQMITLPANTESEGVFYCGAASNNDQSTRVPVTVAGLSSWLTSSMGEFTVTSNIGDKVELSPKIVFVPNGHNSLSDIRWEKLADETSNIAALPYSGPSYMIHSVAVKDAGVYYAYWRDWYHTPNGFFFRLIVRACTQGRWGAPFCYDICDYCYNDGICDDATGKCVCRPGFTGANCLTACGQNKFGWNCEHECEISIGVTSCPGSVFCMPDPAGCSCMSGWMGEKCDEPCPTGMYGAGCTESCNCQSGSCNRFTGRCNANGDCLSGWTGENCQIPQNCPSGYYGSSCTAICNCYFCDKNIGCRNFACYTGYFGDNCDIECHCYDGGGCDRQTGKCYNGITSGREVCLPGYVSNNGANVDNCQQSSSCFAQCTKTCHCLNYIQCDQETGQCPVGTLCQPNWIGLSCQTGIVEVTSQKTNPQQILTVTGTVTGFPMPTADEVTVVNLNNNMNIGEQINMNVYGQYIRVTFNVSGQHQGFRCFYTQSVTGLVAQASFTTEYYTLPILTSTIIPNSITSNSVVLQWDAWNHDNGDTGDGPIISYNIYNIYDLNTFVATASVLEDVSPIIWPIHGLTPNRRYRFNVRPVREGPGGEGTGAIFVDVTTLPGPTDTSSTTRKMTTNKRQGETITTSKHANVASTGTYPTPNIPDRPSNVRAKSATTSSVTLAWNSPEDSSQVITNHRIDYRVIHLIHQNDEILRGKFTNTTTNIDTNSEEMFVYVLSNLNQGTSYEIFISAENIAGVGDQASIIVETKPLGSSNQSVELIAGGTSGGAIFVILIIIVVIVFRKHYQTNNVPVKVEEGNQFKNRAFSADIEAYEDVDDQEYEDIASNKWDIDWEDLQLTGDILGKGNFGDVQLGHVKIRNKWILAAVKTLKQGTPEIKKVLFKEEFDTMTRIGYHPNVVNTLGSCENEGSFYVVLEYVHHGNLRKFLRKCRKELKESRKKEQPANGLTPDQLLNFALGVANAMKHIAECGVIHRDLAARNVLVARGYIPKVADFGMSREDDVYVQTSSYRVPTRWLSIESMTKKMYSTKSDVWSFGILLWEIATFGGTPYPDMETKELAYQLTSNYRMERPENCEHDMYKLMLQCWKEDPDDRPSFKDIVDILTGMVSKEKIYMSTHFYSNYKYAVICPEKDDN